MSKEANAGGRQDDVVIGAAGLDLFDFASARPGAAPYANSAACQLDVVTEGM